MPPEIRRHLAFLQEAFNSPEDKQSLIRFLAAALILHTNAAGSQADLIVGGEVIMNDDLLPIMTRFEAAPELHEHFLEVLDWITENRGAILEEVTSKIIPSSQKTPVWNLRPANFTKGK